MHWIGTIVVLGIAGWLAWSALGRRYALRIVLDEEGVRSHRGLAKARQSEVIEFLERHVAVEGRAVILGVPVQGGKLRLHFRGKIHSGSQQQIRNFFTLDG